MNSSTDIDLIGLIESSASGRMLNKYFEYNNVSICLIDIVNFSKWCRRYNAKDVVKSMILYNKLINKHLEHFDSLTKIELVGDSCLIVGGMDRFNEESIDTNTEQTRTRTHVWDMVLFCKRLLQANMKVDVFQSELVSLRIGIHIGDVFGTFMENPFKFQMYGNHINTTSRLESSSFPGVIHVSDKVMSILGEYPTIEDFDYGITTTKQFKGIGEIDCAYITIVSRSILVIEELKHRQHIISQHLTNRDIEFCSDFELGIEMLKSKIYDIVVIGFEHPRKIEFVVKKLRKFRVWETTNHTRIQNIVVVTTHINNIIPMDALLFNKILTMNKLHQIKHVGKKKKGFCLF